MRPRSKSMYIDRSTINEYDVDVDEQETDTWTAEDDMRIIRQIWEQLSAEDNLPYDEQLEMIEWKKIIIFGHTTSEIKERFEIILSKHRKYRLLSEILKDIEKETLKTIDLPKKPLPAFALFMEDNKDKLKKEAGNSIAKFSKLASKLFKELPENEKEIYKKRSSEIKQEYAEIISKYNLESKSSKVNRKKEKKITPLSIYWNHKKRKHPDVSYTEIRTQYSNLDRNHKLKWILKWLKIKSGEKLNLEKYKIAKNVLSKEEMAIIDEYEGRPKLMNGYAVFVKEFLASNSKKVSPTEIFKKATEMWKTLRPEEKLSYYDASQKIRKEYENFLNSLPKDRKEYELQNSNKKKKNAKSEKVKSNISTASTTQHMNDEKIDKSFQIKKHTKNSKSPRDKKTTTDDNETIIMPDANTSKTDVECDINDDDHFVKPQDKKEKKRSKKKHLNGSNTEINDIPMVLINGINSISELTENKSNGGQHKEQRIKHDHEEYEGSSTNVPIIEEEKKKKKKRKKSSKQKNLDETITSNHQNHVSLNSYTENDSEGNPENSKNLKRKISEPELTELLTPKKNKKNTELTEPNVNSEKVKIKKEPMSVVAAIPFVRPPSSAYKFYVLNIYKGPIDKAKSSYKSLSASKKNSIKKKFEKAYRNFLNDLKEYSKSLESEDCINLQKMYAYGQDDEISDLTDSDDDVN